jgi:acylphosphatase
MKAGPPKLARKYRISGRVQGVGFRYFAERAAQELGLCGYVRNCDDGSVEAYAIGDASALDEFRTRLAQGPRSARVTAVDEWEELVNARYRDFVIEAGW